MKSVYVTVHAQVFLDDDELKAMMDYEDISQDEAVTRMAMAKVPEGNGFKERDILIDLSSFK